MKAATIFVQVALVAAGIFVYDQLRSEAPPVAPDVELEARAPAATDPAPREVRPIVLEGSGGEVLLRRVGALEERLEALERGSAGRTTAVGNTAPPGPVEPGYRPTRIDGSEATGDTTFSDEDLDWFRNVKGEVERIERRERYAKMVSGQLDRLGVQLTADQREGVVNMTVAFRDKVRDAVKVHQQKGQPSDARQAELDKLRVEFDEAVYRLVPAADAEKIVDVLGRYPGFGGRRPGGSGRFGPNR